MIHKGVTLRALEIFEALANSGSVAQAAQATGLSQPAVSQQLKKLETALGAPLVDHSKRPMQLTPAGQSFRARVDAALAQLRLGQTELTVVDLAHIQSLSLGLIDDFDNEITPRLVTLLAKSLSRSQFRLITAPSHQIMTQLEAKELHLGVAAALGATPAGVTAYPLVRDPFVLVVPKGMLGGAPSDFAALRCAPFLRYDSSQVIAQQIESQMARLEPQFETRFEVGAHLALMAMVARGIGWAITTPLGYMRAGRFHADLDVHPLPMAPFAREIMLYAGAGWAGSVPQEIARMLRDLVQMQMIDPAIAALPWLKGEFEVLED